MRISVIVPTYNRAPVLKRALESIAAQTYTDWELIVVDDGSTDDTQNVLREWRETPRPQPTMVLRQTNAGVSCARNRGAAHAQGRWLAFLDSDDEWLPQKLAQQVPLTPLYRWIHGEEIWIRHGRRVNPMKKHAKSGGRIFSRCVDLCCVSPSAVLIEKDTFFEFGGFREDFPVCEDYELWLRLAARFDVGFIETPIVRKHGGHEDQLSRKFLAMDYLRCLALREQLQNPFITQEERVYVAENLTRRAKILKDGFEKHGGQDWPWPGDFKAFIASQSAHSAADLRPRSESSGVL